MAKAKNSRINENSLRVKLIGSLELIEQNRSEDSSCEYQGGRFRRFLDLFKANFQQMMFINLWTVLFALPIIAIIIVFRVLGTEKIGYMIANVQQPYLMGSFGIGISSSMPLTEAKSMLLISYRVMITSIAACLPILGIGIAGNLAVIKKMVFGEALLLRKDKQGRDIPRVTTEFFRGVARYWNENLLLMLVTMVVFAGIANLILTFVNGVWNNSYDAGSIVSLVFAILLILCYFPAFTHLLPSTVTYEAKISIKIKNSLILTLVFFLPTVFILGFAFLPFFLLAAGKIFSLIMFIFILSFGLSFICLLLTNYNDYNHEKVIQPLLHAKMKMQLKKERRKRKKKK